MSALFLHLFLAVQDIFGCDERQWDKLVSSDAIFELMVLWEEQKVRWDSKNDVHLRIDYLLDTLGIDDADVKEKIARFNKERGQVSGRCMARTVGRETISWPISRSSTELPFLSEKCNDS